MQKSYLRIRNLSKEINGNSILKNINIDMDRGKIYGLWGKNGSGKTMLMRCICGLVFPSEGEIVIDNKVIGKNISFPQSVGALISTPGFIEHYSAFQNLKTIASIKKVTSDMEIIHMLEYLDLDSKDKKKVKKYSLGMRQKVGIIAAVMENPELIILDEPINALDEESVIKVKRVLEKHKSQGALIIISCHDRQEMEVLADEVFCLENGEIINKYTIESREYK